MSSLTPSAHAVYRMYNAAGDLLYVGCTANPVKRFTLNHQYIAVWMQETTSIKLVWFPDLATALAGERQAILEENPRYNVQEGGNSRKHRSLCQLCPKCGGPKDPGPSYCKACKRDYNRLRYQKSKTPQG